MEPTILNYGWFGDKLVGTDSHQQLQTELREANNTMQYIAEDIEEKDDKIKEIERAYDMTKKDLDAAIDTNREELAKQKLRIMELEAHNGPNFLDVEMETSTAGSSEVRVAKKGDGHDTENEEQIEDKEEFGYTTVPK